MLRAVLRVALNKTFSSIPAQSAVSIGFRQEGKTDARLEEWHAGGRAMDMRMLLRQGWVYPTLIAIALFGLVIWVFNQFEISIQVAPPSSASVTEKAQPASNTPPTEATNLVSNATQETTTSTATATRSLSVATSDAVAAVRQPDNSQEIARQGKLRIGNQTDFPLRVALLRQVASNDKSFYSEPAHWDFAPQEGGETGLFLSLPEGSLQVQPGDILVAFAQDGSRRYWGPYVVGKTALPFWNSTLLEWQILINQ